jgi:hypothetical protein
MKAFRSGVATMCVLSVAVVSSPASASLIGDTISANGDWLSPITATIGAGVEFKGIIGYHCCPR